MKLQVKTKMMILAKCEPTKSADGKSTYYKATVMQGQEAGQISVSEDIYNSLTVGKEESFVCEYRDDYKSFKILNFDYTATAPHIATTAPKADK